MVHFSLQNFTLKSSPLARKHAALQKSDLGSDPYRENERNARDIGMQLLMEGAEKCSYSMTKQCQQTRKQDNSCAGDEVEDSL